MASEQEESAGGTENLVVFEQKHADEMGFYIIFLKMSR
jgi:hypothetical protein